MESRLFQALKAFKGADGCEANLFKEFKKIAEEAFFSGYFLVNGGCKDAYKLKLTCIEFYYHEDDGNIKDEKKCLKGKDEFGYALGAVCPNPSGVDVLFDDPQKKYHASFLIRGYKAIVPGEKIGRIMKKEKIGLLMIFGMIYLVEQKMLSNGKFCIEWIDESDETLGYAEPMQRININDNRLWGFKRVEKL